MDHVSGEHFEYLNRPKKTKRQHHKQVATVTEEEFTESPRGIEYIEIEPISWNEYSLKGEEQEDLITDDDAVNVTDEQKEEPTPKTSQTSRRKLRALATYKNSTAIEGKRKYKCRICEYAANDISNLRGHEKRHSNIKPYGCLKCDKAFYTRTDLNNHTRRHNGEKPFICCYCGNRFVTAGILNKHEKWHLGKREHKCDQCEKRFFHASHLRNHTVVHTQERNYECETCQAKFTLKKSLELHMKLHENALAYECIICHMRFNQRCTLLSHMKNKHKVLRADAESKNSVTDIDSIGEA